MSVGGAEKVIVKLGGEVVASPQLAVICAGVARLVAAGVQVIIVHGGGPQVSALQERLQIPVRKVAGRRYTDEDTLRVLKMAVAGGVNVDLCAGLRAAGVRPVGLHGAVRATRRASYDRFQSRSPSIARMRKTPYWKAVKLRCLRKRNIQT